MAVFADTSALYAALDAADTNHQSAAQAWRVAAAERQTVVTTNYVLVETLALLGRRLGLQAVREFQSLFLPALEVVWVDEALHALAIASLLTAGERQLSLVDCVSFQVMRSLGLEVALAFDAHFEQQGFRCLGG